MTNEEKDDFIKWVKSLTKYEFYEECVKCRRISFGTSDGDDMDYFYKLVNAYAAAEKQKFIDKACEVYKKDLLQCQRIISNIRKTAENIIDIEGSVCDFRKAMEE